MAAQPQNNVVSILLRVTEALLANSRLDATLGEVTDAALELLPVDDASLCLFDTARNVLLAMAQSGAAGHKPFDFQPGEGVLGWVAEKGEIVRVSDVLEDTRFVEAIDDHGSSTRSLLAVPLVFDHQVMGVLSVTSKEVDVFDKSHEELAALLANCTVPAIDRVRLERLAVTDSETGAFNRRYLFPRLKQEIRRARRHDFALSVLVTDVDGFKEVTDRHGLNVAHRILRAVADRVRSCVRTSDIVVRAGGDEFVILLPHTEEAPAFIVAERIRDAISFKPFDEGGVEISRTLSMGLATWSGEEGARTLQKRAELAMYEAKRRGRNQVAVAVHESLRSFDKDEPSGIWGPAAENDRDEV